MKTLKIIQHPAFALIGFLFSMGVNLPHIVYVYKLMSPVSMPDWVIYPSFSVLELGILILAINGRESASKFFTGLIFCVNLAFYWHIVKWSYSYEIIQPVSMGVLLSAIPAYMIYFFSHLFAEYIGKDNWQYEKETARNDLENAKNNVERLQNKVRILQSQIEQNRLNHEAKLADLEMVEKLGNLQELALEILSEKMGFTNLAESSRKKYIQTRKATLRANGTSGKERNTIELEIILLEMAKEVRHA